ncbi:MAG: hypothetical protein QOH96_932 [Blastocatellia bacterium]|nr:hypothetical protein [Blastocatellia bacterium]
MQDSRKQGPSASPIDSTRKQEHLVDPEATSADTLADIQEKEETIDSGNSTRSPSPDGAYDEDRSNRADGSDSGGPM